MNSVLPTDALAAAEFVFRCLYRPIELPGGAGYHAAAETENVCMGDVWFWTDDNAKLLEMMSRPEVWRRFPNETAELLRFVRAMCCGPFIFRRVSVPRLERLGQEGSFLNFAHSLLHLRCDLGRGVVAAGVRFHDGRTADNVFLTGNYVQFLYKGQQIALDIEDAIVNSDIVEVGRQLVLSHSSELSFTHRRNTIRLGRATYTYTIEAASMLIAVEATLDVDPAAEVSDVVLTIGHDNLSHGINNVTYRRIEVESESGPMAPFVAGDRSRSAVSLDRGAPYYSLVQEEIAGLALAVHTRPREPDRLRRIDYVVRQPGRLHYVAACYRFDGPCRGVRLVAAEDKLLTSGGFYDCIADYSGMLREAVAVRQLQKNPHDFSISYDYGAELNAVAKCFAAAPLTELPEALALRPELREFFDRYLGYYFERFIAGHYERKNTIISRNLAFVILGVITMYRATEDAAYLDRLRRLCEVLLDFEVRYDDICGEPASGFTYGIASERSAFVDGHSSSLLALTQSLRYVDDPRFVAAIDRGLRAYCIETARVHADPRL